MLVVSDLHAYYGKSHVLQGVSLRIDEGEIVSLLGRNGAGRSTTIKAIMGEVSPRGSVEFKGREIAGLASHEIARRGLGYVPENRDVFPPSRCARISCWDARAAAGTAGGRWRTPSSSSRICAGAPRRRVACSRAESSRC